MGTRTQYYLLNALAGWRAASLSGAVLANGDATLSLQALPGSERPLVDTAGSFGGLQAAIGVAIDSQDRVYILDSQTCLLKRFDRCSQQFVILPCIGEIGSEPRRFCRPHGLAISCQDDIYIADAGNRRVQILSVHGLALRHLWGPLRVIQSGNVITTERVIAVMKAPTTGTACASLTEFPTATWEPWDVAVSPDNQVYITDYANGLIHVFDPDGNWLKAYTGAGQSTPPLSKPTRLALDRQNRIYVIQENQSYIVVLDTNGTFLGTVETPDQIEGQFCPVAVAVDLEGNLCLSDCVTRQLYFYQPNGDGGWCPSRCFGTVSGFAASIVFDRSGHPVYADGGQRVCQLAPPPMYPTKGLYYSAALDSKTYRCVWHRITLAGSVPPGAAVKVDTLTAEYPKTIDEIQNLPESRWGTAQLDADATLNNWDCLIQSPPGRYLWLRLTLSGDGTVTPSIENIKVFYPRASSIQFLPSVYQADPVSSDFLGRFLSIFDTIRGGTSEQITTIARYFDPMATPANPQNVGGTDFLSWLASWLGMSLQSSWPVKPRRELVRQAHRLYALRGTPAGLRLHIELYAGVRPLILELFRLRRWGFVNQATLGNNSTLFGAEVMNRLQVGTNSQIGSFSLVDYGNPQFDLFNAYAYQFLVFVPRWPGATTSDQMALQQIIDIAKPAHTVGQLRWAEPRFRVGIQAYVGVDTVVGKYPQGVIEGQGQLGYDTVLGSPAEQKARPKVSVGRTTRLGCKMVLN